MNKTKILIRRGEQPTEEILCDGEIAYNKTKKCFYVGDGKTPMNEIHEFTSLVVNPHGKIYAVSVDENGIPTAKQITLYSKDPNKIIGNLYIE
jgi:hypothetical protein